MPGTAFQKEFNPDLIDSFAVISDGFVVSILLIPWHTVPLVIGGIHRDRRAHLNAVGESVGLVPVGHVSEELIAFRGAEIHKAADSHLPALVGRKVELSDLGAPERGIFLVILVAGVGV